jgi:hypothetical protein
VHVFDFSHGILALTYSAVPDGKQLPENLCSTSPNDFWLDVN